jgi:hypothetical protein
VHDKEGAVKAGKDVVAEMVRVSLASGVLSKHTAFVAVEERDEATEGTMKVRKIPITFEKPAYQQPPSHPVLPLCTSPRHLAPIRTPSDRRVVGRVVSAVMQHSPVGARDGSGGAPQRRKSAAKPASGGFLSFFGGAKKGAAAPVQSSSSRDCKDKEKTKKKKSVAMDRKREDSRSSAVEGGPPRSPMPISASASACAAPGRPMLAPSAKSSMSAAAPSFEINDSLSRSPRSSSSASPMLRSNSPPTNSLVFAKADAEEERCAALDYDDDASSEDEEEPKIQVQRKEKKEEMEEKKEEEKAGPPPAQMRDVIMKQKASGSWDWSDAASLVGLTADKLRSGIPSAKLLAGTRLRSVCVCVCSVGATLRRGLMMNVAAGGGGGVWREQQQWTRRWRRCGRRPWWRPSCRSGSPGRRPTGTWW